MCTEVATTTKITNTLWLYNLKDTFQGSYGWSLYVCIKTLEDSEYI